MIKSPLAPLYTLKGTSKRGGYKKDDNFYFPLSKGGLKGI
jgi:hypothetical protein